MAKGHPLGFRVEQAVKEGLERAARADGRSVSNLAERILTKWLEDHGFMEPPPSVDIQVKFVDPKDRSVTLGPRYQIPGGRSVGKTRKR